jgi:hypothetical protein
MPKETLTVQGPGSYQLNKNPGKPYILAARKKLQNHGIDRDDAPVSDDAPVYVGGDAGCFVTVHLWVSDEEI